MTIPPSPTSSSSQPSIATSHQVSAPSSTRSPSQHGYHDPSRILEAPNSALRAHAAGDGDTVGARNQRSNSVLTDAEAAAVRDVPAAVTAPDSGWPPTLEEWHLTKERTWTRPHRPSTTKAVAAPTEPESSSASLAEPAERPPNELALRDSIAKVQQLPQEVLMRIFAFLDPFGLAAAALVCRLWAKVALDDATWRGAFAVHFGLDWGADESRTPLRLAPLTTEEGSRQGSDALARATAMLDASDSNVYLKARALCLRRLRPNKWKQEFIARWELARRWRKTKTQPISTNPSISTIARLAFAPPSSSHASSFLLSASLVYGVACRSDPFTGRRISMGFLDASGNTNGAGIGNPNVEFSPDVTCVAMGADARSIVWGFRQGHVSLTLLSKQGTNPRGLVRSIRFDEQSRHRGLVVDIALPLAAGNEGGARSVFRSPSKLAQHLSEMGEVAATFVTAGEDGTVRLWAWPLEKSHGVGVGGSASGANPASFRRTPLWKGSVHYGLPAPAAGGSTRTPLALSKVAYNPTLGVIVAGAEDGTIIVWSHIDIARLVMAPVSTFGTTGPTTLTDAQAIDEWRAEVQRIYDAVQVHRIMAQPTPGCPFPKVVGLEIVASSSRRVSDKAHELSILAQLQRDTALHRYDLVYPPPAVAAACKTEAGPGGQAQPPWVRRRLYGMSGLTGFESSITAFRTDLDTLSANERSRADEPPTPSPAIRSPSLLPTLPSQRSTAASEVGDSSVRAERDPVRVTLPVSSAYTANLAMSGDRGLYSERPYLVAGTEQGRVLVWSWDAEGEPILEQRPNDPSKATIALKSAFVEPYMTFSAHSAAISAVDVTSLGIVVGTVDGSIKVFNSLNGEMIRTFNDKAATRHPSRMLAEGLLTEEQAAQFRVHQIIAGEDSLIAAIGPHVVAWRTDTMASKGKAGIAGLGSGAAKKAGGPTKARSQRAASWQTKYQAHAELEEAVKESAALLKKENRDRQASYERMRWATGPPELGGLDDEEALEYAIMLSREEAAAASVRGTTGQGEEGLPGDFDLDAALAEYDADEHAAQERHTRQRDDGRGQIRHGGLGSDDSADGDDQPNEDQDGPSSSAGAAAATPSPMCSPSLRGISTPSRAWEIINSAGHTASYSSTPDRWGAASKVRTVSVPGSARKHPASATSASGSGSGSGWNADPSWQAQVRRDGDDEGDEEWPSVSPPSLSSSLGGVGRSPGLGAWSLGSSRAAMMGSTPVPGAAAASTTTTHGSLSTPTSTGTSPPARVPSSSTLSWARIANRASRGGGGGQGGGLSSGPISSRGEPMGGAAEAEEDEALRFALELSMAEEESRLAMQRQQEEQKQPSSSSSSSAQAVVGGQE